MKVKKTHFFVLSDEEVGKTEMDEIKALSLDAIETATQDEDDEVGLPVLDPISGQVDACVLGKIRRFGRITTMHPGTDEEAKAIYCGLHGCRKLKGALFVPPERSLMVWYHKGCSLLAGSAAEKEASRKEHLKMFNTMFETPCPPAVPTVDAGPAPPSCRPDSRCRTGTSCCLDGRGRAGSFCRLGSHCRTQQA